MMHSEQMIVPRGILLRRFLLAPTFWPVCFGCYMALRIATLFIQPLEQSSDFLWYYQRAMEIASGAGYADGGVLTAFWPVGWPGFLGILFTLAGPSALSGQIANLIFSMGVFVLTAMLGSAIFRDQLVGRVAVLILTFYPNQIGYVPLLSTEVFYQFLLLLIVFLLIQDRLLTTLLAGILFGMASLTKTQTLLIPLLILPCMLAAAPSLQSLRKAVKTIALIYAMIVPLDLSQLHRVPCFCPNIHERRLDAGDRQQS
ncbi:MAG: hypothetical protein ACJ8AW_20165 [Rhodopila sp.]